MHKGLRRTRRGELLRRGPPSCPMRQPAHAKGQHHRRCHAGPSAAIARLAACRPGRGAPAASGRRGWFHPAAGGAGRAGRRAGPSRACRVSAGGRVFAQLRFELSLPRRASGRRPGQLIWSCRSSPRGARVVSWVFPWRSCLLLQAPELGRCAGGHRGRAVHQFAQAARARDRRDMTVPTGTPVILATSS